jgi:hypothetical protein
LGFEFGFLWELVLELELELRLDFEVLITECLVFIHMWRGGGETGGSRTKSDVRCQSWVPASGRDEIIRGFDFGLVRVIILVLGDLGGIWIDWMLWVFS